MVVFDPKAACCELYEVKHSKERHPSQTRHIKDADKSRLVELRYGSIEGRFVVYRGESGEVDGVEYLNAEEYLKSLAPGE